RDGARGPAEAIDGNLLLESLLSQLPGVKDEVDGTQQLGLGVNHQADVRSLRLVEAEGLAGGAIDLAIRVEHRLAAQRGHRPGGILADEHVQKDVHRRRARSAEEDRSERSLAERLERQRLGGWRGGVLLERGHGGGQGRAVADNLDLTGVEAEL